MLGGDEYGRTGHRTECSTQVSRRSGPAGFVAMQLPPRTSGVRNVQQRSHLVNEHVGQRPGAAQQHREATAQCTPAAPQNPRDPACAPDVRPAEDRYNTDQGQCWISRVGFPRACRRPTSTDSGSPQQGIDGSFVDTATKVTRTPDRRDQAAPAIPRRRAQTPVCPAGTMRSRRSPGQRS